MKTSTQWPLVNVSFAICTVDVSAPEGALGPRQNKNAHPAGGIEGNVCKASAKRGKTGVSINYFTHESIQSIYTPLKIHFEPSYTFHHVSVSVSRLPSCCWWPP